MKLNYWLFIVPVAFLVIGCSANVETFDSTASVNQQMTDLETSYKAGAITEDEYNKAKTILLNRYK